MGVSQIEIGSSAAKKVPRATQAIGKHIKLELQVRAL